MVAPCPHRAIRCRNCELVLSLPAASNMNTAIRVSLALVRRQPSPWLQRASRELVPRPLRASLLLAITTLSQCCAGVLRPAWCCSLLHRTKRLSSQCDPAGKVHRSTRLRAGSPFMWLSFAFALMLTSAELASACGPGRRLPPRQHHRRLTPLVFKQHIPNVSENTLGASGLSEGRVTRNHSRFKELVPNYNADIIFRDDEGTGADRLMTQRLKEKLNTLAISVMNQWPGVKLRVTQSWHEGNQYAGESLHYEGRAVDITTNDRDRSKLGMLARLAVEAGFDWVYYESRVWIHCSVKSEKSESARNGGCFDENSVVYDRSGPRLIKDVQVGDEILSMNSEGKYEYSPVLMFLDRDPNVERLYYHIETDSGARITATPSHLLFVAEHNSTAEQYQLQKPQFAKDISVGQYLYSTSATDRQGATAILDRVKKISTSNGKGAFAPLTTMGNLVVNNITASCYAVIRSQRLAHLSFLPVRWAHFFVQLGDHLSGYFLSNKSTSTFSSRSDAPKTRAPVQDGVHWYAQVLYCLFRYLIPSRLMFD